MILQKCLSVIKMQGTLLEDCAAKFYQKYSHTNIELEHIPPPPTTPTKIYNHYVEVCFLPLHASEQHWFIGWVRGQDIEG